MKDEGTRKEARVSRLKSKARETRTTEGRGEVGLEG
jgi:hypothetical protein